MSASNLTARQSVPALRARKGGEPIVCLTAYTAPVARLLDPHVDLLLVGDSLGMVVYGLDSTLPVTLDMMIDHGAAVVRTILSDAALTADWTAELDGMRARITGIRRKLAAGLSGAFPALAAVAEQEGMFSLLPLTEAEVLRLRADHAIYMPTSGRINIAGLKTAEVDDVVAKFAALR